MNKEWQESANEMLKVRRRRRCRYCRRRRDTVSWRGSQSAVGSLTFLLPSSRSKNPIPSLVSPPRTTLARARSSLPPSTNRVFAIPPPSLPPQPTVTSLCIKRPFRAAKRGRRGSRPSVVGRRHDVWAGVNNIPEDSNQFQASFLCLLATNYGTFLRGQGATSRDASGPSSDLCRTMCSMKRVV